jgi:two-component system, NtrC family, sensor kinase
MTQRHDPPLILVADDQKPTTVMLERVFEFEGYQVHSVYDGNTAIEAAKTLLPDLLLLDINMPGLDGFEVLQELRELPQTASIPTILITAMGDFTNVVEGLNLGADDYLRKPFHPQELLARAESKMRSRQLEDTLQRRTRDLEALLRVSEELGQHIEIDELLEFTLILATDLTPSAFALIYYLDEHQAVKDYRTYFKHIEPISPNNRWDTLLHDFVNIATHQTVNLETQVGMPHGLLLPIRYGMELRGILGVANTDPYDDDHTRLLIGLSRQIALALQNAELYRIKENYASDLEEQVQERTQELESTQRMLVRSEKLASIGRLAASIAHEINNPLLPIKLDLEGLIEEIEINQTVEKQDVARILENVGRIGKTVERLLGFTGNKKADSAHLQAININTVIDSIVQLNYKLLQQSNIEVIVETGDIPMIFGNRYQLEYVFMNLTLNARDAMPHGGRLRFASYPEGDTVVVVVQDTGEGIPDGIIDTIFEPFVSTKEDGNGLGLYISYDILQKHQAIVNVDSAVNEGTRFTISFETTME